MEIRVGRSDRLLEVQPGSTITNGISAMRLERHVAREGRWGIEGWRGVVVALEPYGGPTGALSFLPDYLVRQTFCHVPFEFSPVPQTELMERYVWGIGCRFLTRQVVTSARAMELTA